MQTRMPCLFLNLLLTKLSQVSTQKSTLRQAQVMNTVKLHKSSMTMKSNKSFRNLPEQLPDLTKKVKQLLVNFFLMRQKKT